MSHADPKISHLNLYAQFADETLGGGGKSSIDLRTSPDEYESKIDTFTTLTLLQPGNSTDGQEALLLLY